MMNPFGDVPDWVFPVAGLCMLVGFVASMGAVGWLVVKVALAAWRGW